MCRISQRIRAIEPQCFAIDTCHYTLESLGTISRITKENGQRLGFEAEALPRIAFIERQSPPCTRSPGIGIGPEQDYAQSRELLKVRAALPGKRFAQWFGLALVQRVKTSPTRELTFHLKLLHHPTNPPTNLPPP